MHPGIAPQALPQASTRLTENPHRYSAFDGQRVNFTQVDRSMHRVNTFPSDKQFGGQTISQSSYPGVYNGGIACQSGSVNIDNQCLCPGSKDSAPFNQQPPATTASVTNHLFSPFGTIPQLTPSAQKLVMERSPLPSGHSNYYNLDAPLPCGANGHRR